MDVQPEQPAVKGPAEWFTGVDPSAWVCGPPRATCVCNP